MYFDTCYIAKFYLNEQGSDRVRELVRKADSVHSTVWALAEFHAVLHRHLREGALVSKDAQRLAASFAEHVEQGLWSLIPVSDALLRRTSARMISAPGNIFLRTADAVHLMTAHDLGETEVWTSDRHMLAAALHFGLGGRSV